MARERKEDLRIGGLPIAVRFALSMSIALAVVMGGAGFLLSKNTRSIASQGIEHALQAAAVTHADISPPERELKNELVAEIRHTTLGLTLPGEGEAEQKLAEKTRDLCLRTAVEGVETVFRPLPPTIPWEQQGELGTMFAGGHGVKVPIRFTAGPYEGQTGYVYQVNEKNSLITLPQDQEETNRGLLGLMLGSILLVVVIGAAVAYWIAAQVSKPLVDMVDDVRQIARGNLAHRTRAKGGGEVALLARTIDRMAESLSDAQEAELELSIREREMEVAREVREALLPQKIPALKGYSLSAMHISCPEPEGDFHDAFEVAGGRIGLLVCQVNGRGVPGALVGATGRAYLRSELERGGDVAEAMKKVNRELARDVRRGMYITALYVVFDPKEGIATVASAGHKQPLVRYAASEGKVRLVQPEGIALAFDKGPVFDRSLQVQRVPIDPGDRLVLATTGAVRVTNPDGAELGEKGFYQLLLRNMKAAGGEVLTKLQHDIEAYADEEDLPADVSVLLLAREG